jgi:hypothetical protein
VPFVPLARTILFEISVTLYVQTVGVLAADTVCVEVEENPP